MTARTPGHEGGIKYREPTEDEMQVRNKRKGILESARNGKIDVALQLVDQLRWTDKKEVDAWETEKDLIPILLVANRLSDARELAGRGTGLRGGEPEDMHNWLQIGKVSGDLTDFKNAAVIWTNRMSEQDKTLGGRESRGKRLWQELIDALEEKGFTNEAEQFRMKGEL